MAIVKWNYRVIRHVAPSGGETFAFHEVHQAEGEDARIEPFAVVVSGKDVKELYDKLRHLLGAIGQPVLDYDRPVR